MDIKTAIKNYTGCIPKGTTTVIFNLSSGIHIVEFYESKTNYSINNLLKNEAYCNGRIHTIKES